MQPEATTPYLIQQSLSFNLCEYCFGANALKVKLHLFFRAPYKFPNNNRECINLYTTNGSS